MDLGWDFVGETWSKAHRISTILPLKNLWTHFMPVVSFATPWEHQKPIISDVFKGCRKRSVTWKVHNKKYTKIHRNIHKNTSAGNFIEANNAQIEFLKYSLSIYSCFPNVKKWKYWEPNQILEWAKFLSDRSSTSIQKVHLFSLS